MWKKWNVFSSSCLKKCLWVEYRVKVGGLQLSNAVWLTWCEAAQVHTSKSVIAIYQSNCEWNISLKGLIQLFLPFMCILATYLLLLPRNTNVKGQMMIGSGFCLGFIIAPSKNRTNDAHSFERHSNVKKKNRNRNRNKNSKQICAHFQTVLRTISIWFATCNA